jgi:kynureninase
VTVDELSITSPEYARALDAADPLAAARGEFVIEDAPLYLDGNSLGRLSHAARARLVDVIDREWGRDLIGGWQRWIELPTEVGDELGAALLGAAAGQVVVSDSTTVNLYKLAAAALSYQARRSPEKRVLLSDDDNFPTDRYVLAGLAEACGFEYRQVRGDPITGPDPEHLTALLAAGDVALLSLSHVAYRSGALLDMAPINRAARAAGTLTLWDLCHSVGSVPVRLDADGADLAVGCTYKYVNSGPGGPAFLYVRHELVNALVQPIHGWFGQADQFAMGPGYEPVAGIGRFLTGTPNVLGTVAVQEGARLLAAAGIEALRAKSVALTEYLVALSDAWLAPLGFTIASPRDSVRRGSHVSLRHPDAFRICRAYIEQAGVVPDFRAPDRLRLGLAPIYTRYQDVYEAMRRLRDLVEAGAHTGYDATPTRVT